MNKWNQILFFKYEKLLTFLESKIESTSTNESRPKEENYVLNTLKIRSGYT